MSTNNFTFENMCVVVEDKDWYDGWVEDTAEFLSQKIKGLEVPAIDKWIGDARVLGFIDYEKNDGEHYARINIVFTSGYYADGCLDYIIERGENDDGYTYEGEFAIKTIEKKIDAKVNTIKKELRKLGTEVVKVAQFSNGEAVYKKVNRK